MLDEEVWVRGACVSAYRDDKWASDFFVDVSRNTFIAKECTDTAGTARFNELALGSYQLVIDGIGSDECRTSISFPEDESRARLVVPLGSASVVGQVFNDDGVPAADVTVIAAQDVPEQAPYVWFNTRTDANGRFAFHRLAGRPGHVVVLQAVGQGVHRTATVHVGRGETRSVILGSPLGQARWSGTVRLPSGTALQGPSRLFFRSQENRHLTTALVGRDGDFRVTLDGGRYVVRVGSESTPLLDEPTVVGEISRDLTVPTIVLHGRVGYVGTKHSIARGPASEAVIELRRIDSESAALICLRGDQSYCFVGLEPGSYELNTRPWPTTSSADGRIAIEVTAALDEIELDLSLTDPR